MSILIDLILVVIISMSIFSGYRKGLIRSVMNLVTFIAAFVSAWLFYPVLGNYYKDNIFLSKITQIVQDAFSALIHNGIDTIDLETLFNDKPQAFTDIISRFSANGLNIENYYSEQIEQGARNITENISSYIADPIAVTLSNILAFITIFFAVVIILKIFTFLLDIIFKLPVLNTLNRALGLGLGAICGLLYVLVISTILKAISPALEVLLPDIYNSSMISNSIIIGLSDRFNVIENIMSFLQEHLTINLN